MKRSKYPVMELEISKKDNSFYFFSKGYYFEDNLKMEKIFGDVANNFQKASKITLSILDIYEDNLCELKIRGFGKKDSLEKNIFSTYVNKHNNKLKFKKNN